MIESNKSSKRSTRADGPLLKHNGINHIKSQVSLKAALGCYAKLSGEGGREGYNNNNNNNKQTNKGVHSDAAK